MNDIKFKIQAQDFEGFLLAVDECFRREFNYRPNLFKKLVEITAKDYLEYNKINQSIKFLSLSTHFYKIEINSKDYNNIFTVNELVVHTD